MGGWNDKGLKDVIILDLDQGKWDLVVPSGPSMAARYGHTMCLHNENEILVYGGRDDKVIKELGTLTITDTTPLSLKWKVIKTTPQTPYRARHSAHLYKGKMYIVGWYKQR